MCNKNQRTYTKEAELRRIQTTKIKAHKTKTSTSYGRGNVSSLGISLYLSLKI
jgi:hypothetical protein